MMTNVDITYVLPENKKKNQDSGGIPQAKVKITISNFLAV